MVIGVNFENESLTWFKGMKIKKTIHSIEEIKNIITQEFRSSLVNNLY